MNKVQTQAQPSNANVTTLQNMRDGNEEIFNLVKNGEPLWKHRQNANLLSQDQWEQIDEAVVQPVRETLNGVQDLRDRGLEQPLDGIGVIESEYEVADDFKDAETSIAGEARSEEESQGINLNTVPIPVVFKDFSIDARRLDASGRNGRQSLDVSGADAAARAVAEKLEDMLFNGDSSIDIGGNQIEGYTSISNNISFSGVDADASGGSTWSDDPNNSYASIIKAVDKLQQDNFFGPYGVYVSQSEYMDLFDRFTDGSGLNPLAQMQDQLQALDIQFFKPSKRLSSEAVVVQLTRNVVDMAIAEDIQTVQWESPSGMTAYFRVMAVMAPRVKEIRKPSNTKVVGVAQITGI